MSKYINVDCELFFIKELKYFDMLLYSHIRNYTNKKIKFDKSESTIANDFNVCIRTVKGSIATLLKYGFIKRMRIKGYRGNSQRFFYKSIELKQTSLYRERYAINGSFDQETENIINDFKKMFKQ